MKHSKIKASIIGATGYTGMELLRVLLEHPHVELKHLVSRQQNNTPLTSIFPRLKGNGTYQNLVINDTAHEIVAADSDVVFLCLPHMASQEVIDTFLGKTKIIDMSADFRLNKAEDFKTYYNIDHTKPEYLDGRFVYGLPEINGNEIKKADNVANPGCFALLVQLLLLPFKNHITHAHVSAISGTSGGGRNARDPVDHPFCAQNIRSYLINEHRHMPEIMNTLDLSVNQLNFTPTVGPFLRGIFATAFVETDAVPKTKIFDKSPFVRITEKCELTNVVGTNYCDISYLEGKSGTYIAQGAIDNLLRGAAGTAVQNMNLMFGLDETTALTFTTPVYP